MMKGIFKMKVHNNQLVIKIDGEEMKLDEEFLHRAIHDKLYNIEYRRKRNLRIAKLVKLGKEAELAELA